MNGHDDESRGYASPACAMHEHDGGDGDAGDDVAAWRERERERLIALRRGIDVAERHGVVGGLRHAWVWTGVRPVRSPHPPLRIGA